MLKFFYDVAVLQIVSHPLFLTFPSFFPIYSLKMGLVYSYIKFSWPVRLFNVAATVCILVGEKSIDTTK